VVRLEPWGEGDLALVQLLMGDPVMTEHLGGPESPEKLVDRQKRYAQLAGSGKGRMLKIVDEAGTSVGSVGYWEKSWRDELVWEIGWMVLPAFQGRGIAGQATEQAVAMAGADGKHRFLHAFPSVENAASNAICRKLGFTLIAECDFEFPPGHMMRCNDWRLDLEA
jgi:RimJ/RimL family protein N-acetyltransferase